MKTRKWMSNAPEVLSAFQTDLKNGLPTTKPFGDFWSSLTSRGRRSDFSSYETDERPVYQASHLSVGSRKSGFACAKVL